MSEIHWTIEYDGSRSHKYWAYVWRGPEARPAAARLPWDDWNCFLTMRGARSWTKRRLRRPIGESGSAVSVVDSGTVADV